MPVSASLLAISGAVRAASLNLCTDEYLLLLARPFEIASVSRLSHDPQDSPLWRVGQRFPANRGTLETALASRPNLLITMGGGGKASSLIARRMKLRVIDLAYPSTIADVEQNMIRVAHALGEQSRSTVWRRRLERLRAGRPARRDTVFLSGGGNSVSSGSLAAAWMEMAGFRQRQLSGGRMSLEAVAVDPPQVILRSNYRDGQRSLGRQWLDHPLVKRARSTILATDGRPWTCAGPLMLYEVQRLRASR
jgi:iron complex transport system substrate-binding protein